MVSTSEEGEDEEVLLSSRLVLCGLEEAEDSKHLNGRVARVVKKESGDRFEVKLVPSGETVLVGRGNVELEREPYGGSMQEAMSANDREAIRILMAKSQRESQARARPSSDPMEDFVCAICHELLFKPVVNSCGHAFCFWCINAAMDPLAPSSCVMCRSRFEHLGAMLITTGEGTAKSSGAIMVRSANSGVAGGSGRLVFSSGSAVTGNSGVVLLGSGAATVGTGGAVGVSVGSGTSGAGGAMSLLSGRSTVHSGGTPLLDERDHLVHRAEERTQDSTFSAETVQTWMATTFLCQTLAENMDDLGAQLRTIKAKEVSKHD